MLIPPVKVFGIMHFEQRTLTSKLTKTGQGPVEAWEAND